MQIYSGIKLLKTTWKDKFGSDALFCLPQGSCRRALDCSDAPSFSMHRGTHSRISPVRTAVCSPDRGGHLCKLTSSHTGIGNTTCPWEHQLFLVSGTLLIYRDHILRGRGFLHAWVRMLCPWFEDHVSALSAPNAFRPWIHSLFTISHRNKEKKRRAQRKQMFQMKLNVSNELKCTFFFFLFPPCA